jgi:hypothetical protein
MSNADTEQESRFGDKAADADSLEAGSVVWIDGSSPALVAKVNTVDDDDPGAGNASVEVARLDVETVHVDDLATEYVDPDEEVGGPGRRDVPLGGAQTVAVPAEQPPADDPSRQTTPTGADAGGGSATVDAGAAQAAREGAVDTTNPPPPAATVPPTDREADQERRIAELEAELAETRAGREGGSGTSHEGAGSVVADRRPDGDEGTGGGPASPPTG